MHQPIRHRLTPAQRSALECAGLHVEPLTPGERALRDAWSGNLLHVEPEDLDAVIDGVNDRSNAEDEAADHGIPGARGASTALTNLAQALMRIRRSFECERVRGDDDGLEYGHPSEARRW
jgi:hypothetical protein